MSSNEEANARRSARPRTPITPEEDCRMTLYCSIAKYQQCHTIPCPVLTFPCRTSFVNTLDESTNPDEEGRVESQSVFGQNVPSGCCRRHPKVYSTSIVDEGSVYGRMEIRIHSSTLKWRAPLLNTRDPWWYIYIGEWTDSILFSIVKDIVLHFFHSRFQLFHFGVQNGVFSFQFTVFLVQ